MQSMRTLDGAYTLWQWVWRICIFDITASRRFTNCRSILLLYYYILLLLLLLTLTIVAGR